MDLQPLFALADPQRLAAAQAGQFRIDWKRRTEDEVTALVFNLDTGNVYHTGFRADGGSYCSCPDKRHRGGGNPCKHCLVLADYLSAHPDLPLLDPAPDLSLVRSKRSVTPNGGAA